MSGDKPPSVETVRGPYPTYVEQKSTGKVVPVVQAYCFSKYVGSFDLYFDSNGDLKTPVDGSGVNFTKTSLFVTDASNNQLCDKPLQSSLIFGLGWSCICKRT
jgi:2',3'-cyclic-nucleotide 2'-phosphodiesterase (5'-nucleotidase family)